MKTSCVVSQKPLALAALAAVAAVATLRCCQSKTIAVQENKNELHTHTQYATYINTFVCVLHIYIYANMCACVCLCLLIEMHLVYKAENGTTTAEDYNDDDAQGELQSYVMQTHTHTHTRMHAYNR